MQYIFPAQLQTGRTMLRPVRAKDLKALVNVYGDAEVTRYIPVRWHALQDGPQWFARIQTRHAEKNAMQFVIIERGTQTVCGVCLLFNFDLGNAYAEVGYALARSHWGRGLVHEAVGRLLQYAFDDLGARRIEAVIDPRNTASERVLTRFGFRREGLLRERYARDGELIDVALYGLLRRERETEHAQR
jgi:RimJ/RimL family protein N-acetyltransferase